MDYLADIGPWSLRRARSSVGCPVWLKNLVLGPRVEPHMKPWHAPRTLQGPPKSYCDWFPRSFELPTSRSRSDSWALQKVRLADGAGTSGSRPRLSCGVLSLFSARAGAVLFENVTPIAVTKLPGLWPGPPSGRTNARTRVASPLPGQWACWRTLPRGSGLRARAEKPTNRWFYG